MSQNANLIEEIETNTGRNAARDYAEKHIAPSKHAGELAMNEYLLEFSGYRLSEDIPVIVLFEEKKIITLLEDVANVSLISVRSFLNEMAMINALDLKEFMDSIAAYDPDSGLGRDAINGYDAETSATDVEIDWKRNAGHRG